jgi:putative SOS response-associated peptidase YedK
MCGYIEISGEHQQSFMQFSKQKIVNQFTSRLFKRYYPAFGQDPNKTIDIVIEENGVLKQVAATWWFDCSNSFEGLRVGTRTTFNARNLDSSYWQGALQYNRAIVLGTGIGESKVVGKTKHQYYMQSDDVFVLGALYRKFSDDRYSCAVITRDAHPKMEPYHHKAFPCFLPHDDQFLQRWLSQSVQQHPEINKELNFPTLYPTLKVQRVKTYKDKVPYQSFSPVILHSDLLVIQRSG